MPPKARTESNVPLLCSLCPKTPTFSDISHLLTHMSSKSHLSHRFKLQIRSQTDLASQQKLDDFDHWYQQNNLNALLADRLAANNNKKARSKNARGNQPAKKEQRAKKEEARPSEEPSIFDTPQYRAPVPQMHLWPTSRAVSTALSSSGSEWEPGNIYATPSVRRAIPNFTQESLTDISIDPGLTTPWKFDNAPEETEKLSECLKLKGILWPGMNLFDAATPEMKRKRNQKKEDAVLESLMATSSEVLPLEYVYLTDGQLRNTRDVFDPPSCDTSPNRIEPTPKKRKPRRATLADVSVNAPLTRAHQGRKVAPSGSPLKREGPLRHDSEQHVAFPWSTPALNPLAGFGRTFIATSEEEEEFRMTVGDLGKNKKRAISVFQDVPELSPGRTESPLPDARFDFSSNHDTLAESLRPLSDYLEPNPLTEPAPIRIFGKENSQPEVVHQFRRSMATSHTYQSPLFHDQTLTYNPLYTPFQSRALSRPFPFGGQQLGYDTARPSTDYTSTFQGDFKPLEPPSQGVNPQGYGQRPNNRGHNMHFGM